MHITNNREYRIKVHTFYYLAYQPTLIHSCVACLNVCNVQNVHQQRQYIVDNDVQQSSILLVLSEVKWQDRELQFHVSGPRVFSVLCRARTSKPLRMICPEGRYCALTHILPFSVRIYLHC